MYTLVFILLSATAQTGHLYAVIEAGSWKVCKYDLHGQRWRLKIPLQHICPPTLMRPR